MDGCENWTVKKAECWRIDAFELWCWRRLLRVPWTARRSNKSILKEILEKILEKTLESPLDSKEIQVHSKGVLGVHWKDWCWSWNSNTLATWWEELTHLKRPWSWERLRTGGEGDDRGWDGWMALPIWWIRVWVDSRSWWWTGRPDVLRFMGSHSVGHDWETELNWSKIEVTTIFWRNATLLFCQLVPFNLTKHPFYHLLSWVHPGLFWCVFLFFSLFLPFLTSSLSLSLSLF